MTAKTVDAIGAPPERCSVAYMPNAARAAIKIPTKLTHQEGSLCVGSTFSFRNVGDSLSAHLRARLSDARASAPSAAINVSGCSRPH